MSANRVMELWVWALLVSTSTGLATTQSQEASFVLGIDSQGRRWGARIRVDGRILIGGAYSHTISGEWKFGLGALTGIDSRDCALFISSTGKVLSFDLQTKKIAHFEIPMPEGIGLNGGPSILADSWWFLYYGPKQQGVLRHDRKTGESHVIFNTEGDLSQMVLIDHALWIAGDQTLQNRKYARQAFLLNRESGKVLYQSRQEKEVSKGASSEFRLGPGTESSTWLLDGRSSELVYYGKDSQRPLSWSVDPLTLEEIQPIEGGAFLLFSRFVEDKSAAPPIYGPSSYSIAESHIGLVKLDREEILSVPLPEKHRGARMSKLVPNGVELSSGARILLRDGQLTIEK